MNCNMTGIAEILQSFTALNCCEGVETTMCYCGLHVVYHGILSQQWLRFLTFTVIAWRYNTH
jgi:hypothetical protein